MDSTEPHRIVYTVSELNGSVRLLLGTHFGVLWVEGEISNLAQPSSGHFYFTLKDPDAQVRCALFRGPARGLSCKPANGMHVIVRAQVSLYEPRGEYQLIVDYLEETGDGALRRAFEALKQKLAAEGLFDLARKRPIPVPPRCLGVITSPSGAAVRDILSVLRRRFAALPVIVFPVTVQGIEAGNEIARAIALADRLQCCDALILARGGGSLEDLWAFNEESVARAIGGCSIPIVSGVGHETDITIADLVADLRAPTPSAAAEAVSPDVGGWLVRLEKVEGRLHRQVRVVVGKHGQSVDYLRKRLLQAQPEKRMQRNAQRLDELELRFKRAIISLLSRGNDRLQTSKAKLQAHHPAQRVRFLQFRLQAPGRRLAAAMFGLLERHRQSLNSAGETLDVVSPLATLQRGYAIASRTRDGKILRDSDDVEMDESVTIRLAEGVLIGRVLEKRDT